MENKIKTDISITVQSINTNMNGITDFSLIKDKICFGLVNKKFNHQLLNSVPHRDFYDMAIIYHINLSPSHETAYTIDITNNMLKQWDGVEESYLYELACENTPRLERGYITPSIPQQDDDKKCIVCKNFDLILADEDDRIATYYATTKNRTDNGAAVILYDGLLKSLSKQIGSFFVTPLSECQCSFTPGTLDDSEKMLQLVRSINETVICICEEDILSENCFYYDAENHKLEMVG